MTIQTTPTPQTYHEVFERQGIEEQFRTPEHFFFEQGIDAQVFAVPRNILVKGEEYTFNERGQVIHPSAQVYARLGSIGSRTIIRPDAIIHTFAEMGSDVDFGEGSLLQDVAYVANGTTVGKYCSIGIGAKIGLRCEITDDVEVMKGAHIGDLVSIEKNVQVLEGVTVGGNVRILAGSKVASRVKPNTVVYSSASYKRAKRVSHNKDLKR